MTKNFIYDSGAIDCTPRRIDDPQAKQTEVNLNALGDARASLDARGPMPVIVCCPRSGSSLLAVMLDSHPQIAMPPETAFLPKLQELAGKDGEALRRDFFALVTTDRWGASNWNDLAIDKDAYWHRLCALDPFSVTGGLRVLYGMYADGVDKRLFGEKTPADIHCMPLIETFLPEARFIHIVRDARDVVLSLRRTSVGRSVARTAQIWVDMVSIARASAQTIGRYHEVRYEDLVLEPEAVLRKVCDFLELDYSSRMLDYRASGVRYMGQLGDRVLPDGRSKVTHELRARLHENLAQAPRKDRVNTWRQHMSADERAKVEAVAGPLMREMGYNTTDA